MPCRAVAAIVTGEDRQPQAGGLSALAEQQESREQRLVRRELAGLRRHQLKAPLHHARAELAQLIGEQLSAFGSSIVSSSETWCITVRMSSWNVWSNSVLAGSSRVSCAIRLRIAG